jgi:RimJ/RimL family protein N-acetyltransferase
MISTVFECDVKHSIKYLFKEINQLAYGDAVTLRASDYNDYEKFFTECFLNNNIDWLKEYFDSMVIFGYCVGVYGDIGLVSCTDAPSMPYMVNEVQEIGINTLQKYQGKGYATTACIKAAMNIINGRKVPQWSTPIGNIASQKLAERVGFVKLADVLTITL